jgi:hypothetical protein
MEDNGRTILFYTNDQCTPEILEIANKVSVNVEGIHMEMKYAFQNKETLVIVYDSENEPVSVCLLSNLSPTLFLSCLGTSLLKKKDIITGKSHNHATWLLEKVKEYAREKKFIRLTLECDNDLTEYYLKRGFLLDEENFNGWSYSDNNMYCEL